MTAERVKGRPSTGLDLPYFEMLWEKIRQDRKAEQLADWLDHRHPTVFFSQSLKFPTKGEFALELMRKFWKRNGFEFCKWNTTLYLFAEKNPSRDGYHVHGFVCGANPEKIQKIQERLMAYGDVKVERFNPFERGSFYCAKEYIEGKSFFDIYPILQ